MFDEIEAARMEQEKLEREEAMKKAEESGEPMISEDDITIEEVGSDDEDWDEDEDGEEIIINDEL